MPSSPQRESYIVTRTSRYPDRPGRSAFSTDRVTDLTAALAQCFATCRVGTHAVDERDSQVGQRVTGVVGTGEAGQRGVYAAGSVLLH